MALYDRNYSNTVETGYVQEGASVSFMKQTYQLLAASMVAAAVGAYLTMPYVATVMQFKWFIFGAELLVLFFGLSMSRG
ncbi:MAG: Bax inhibitor-1/YccA family protein, partial [Sulfurovum sp.]